MIRVSILHCTPHLTVDTLLESYVISGQLTNIYNQGMYQIYPYSIGIHMFDKFPFNVKIYILNAVNLFLNV